MRIMTGLILGGLFAGAVWSADYRRSDRSSDRGSGRSFDRGSDRGATRTPAGYDIVVQRNIFDRNRQPPPDPRAIMPEGPRAERGYVLTGISQVEGDQFEALIENLRNGERQKVRVGQIIGPGRITRIDDLDSLGYESGGQHFTVRVGTTLDGSVVDVRATAVETPTTAPVVASSGPLSDVEAALKAKRLAELAKLNR
jgi:hypothetical protein